jgi:hypothetical protein
MNYQAQSATVGTGGVVFYVPDDLQSMNLQVGITAAAWVPRLHADITLAASPPRLTTRPTTSPADVEFQNARYENGRLKIDMLDARTFEQKTSVVWDVAAVRKSGKTMKWTDVRYDKGRATYEFAVPADQLAAVVFQTRDLKWQIMPSIPLRPKAPSTTATLRAARE